jgi:hypothetical protein
MLIRQRDFVDVQQGQAEGAGPAAEVEPSGASVAA